MCIRDRYRPWVSSALLKVLPKTAKKVAVLDRTKEPGSLEMCIRDSCCNEIHDRFGLGQTQLAVQKGTASVLAGSGRDVYKRQKKHRFPVRKAVLLSTFFCPVVENPVPF